MATNPADIVLQAHEQFNRLIEFSQCMDPNKSLLQLESGILNHALELGRLAMEAHLALQAPHYKHDSAMSCDGIKLARHSEREGRLLTVFGMVHFSRSYYCGDGQGHYEMDAALNLPPKGPSDFLRMFLERLSNSMSYDDSTNLLADYFPVSRSTRSVADLHETDSQDAQSYYEQAPKPQVDASETILVVQADGKGVPMVLNATDAEALSQASVLPGQKKSGPRREGKKKMATVVTVATYAPLTRTPEQIVASLFDDKTYIPAPNGHSFKRVWATMKGKDAAITQSKTFVAQAMSEQIVDRVLLSDGETALKQRLCSAYPDFVHVLDLIHAMSYLWLAASAQFGKNSDKDKAWVREATLQMLSGKAQAVVEELYVWAEAAVAADCPSKYTPIETAAWYLDGYLDSMRYDLYLAKGWPIATGMVEGACRHVVKDRCERSGQRWTQHGVEGMLRLRCIAENGDWDAYHAYRIEQRHQNVYGRKPTTPQPHVEDQSSVYMFRTIPARRQAA